MQFFWGTTILLFIEASPFYIPTNTTQGSRFCISLSILVIFFFFNIVVILMVMRQYLVVSIGIFLMINDVEHLFICWLPFVSSLESIQALCPFFNQLIFCCCLKTFCHVFKQTQKIVLFKWILMYLSLSYTSSQHFTNLFLPLSSHVHL